MKALSIKEPWVTCILHHGKRTENRTWPPPSWLVGNAFYIHASKKGDDRSGCITASRLAGLDLLLVKSDSPYLGRVVGTAVLAGYVQVLPSGRVDLSHAPAGYTPEDDKWLVRQSGNYGWILRDVEPLAVSVPALGRLGLWDFDISNLKEN
jgi:hypothetical protein